MTRIGFIGCGKMATAIAQGIVQSGMAKTEHLVGADPDSTALAEFSRNFSGSRTVESNQKLIDASDVVFLAVKPQLFHEALGDTDPGMHPPLFVSINASMNVNT